MAEAGFNPCVDLSKLASINQVLVHEVALLKGMATGKVVSILQPKGTGI